MTTKNSNKIDSLAFIDDATVREFLLNNPRFLSENSDIISSDSSLNLKILPFDSLRFQNLQKKYQDLQDHLQELKQNVQSNVYQHEVLFKVALTLQNTPPSERIEIFLEWFQQHYQLAEVRLIVLSYSLGKAKHNQVKYRLFNRFWQPEVRTRFATDKISFASISPTVSQAFFEKSDYQSAGMIPLRISSHSHTGKPSMKKAILVFTSTDGERFLPDSSQSDQLLKKVQILINHFLVV